MAHVSGISGVGALQLHLASFPMNMQRVQSCQVAQSWSGAEVEQHSQVLLWRCELLALNIHVVHILYLGRCSPACKTEQKWDIFLYSSSVWCGDFGVFCLPKSRSVHRQMQLWFCRNIVQWLHPFFRSLGIGFNKQDVACSRFNLGASRTQMFAKLLTSASPQGAQKSPC